MPEGPFGFPRLTELGPFVKPDEIRPNHDTEPGVYPIDFIERVQPQTARDTAMFLGEARTQAQDFILERQILDFQYKQMKLGELLSNSEFSGKLIEIVQDDPEEVKRRIRSGEMGDADKLCAILEFEDNQRERKRCAEKTEEDIERVMDINEKIRSSREYFPPTVFKGGKDTIDGAHRIVALASIIGTEENIWVWEMNQTEQDVIRELEQARVI